MNGVGRDILDANALTAAAAKGDHVPVEADVVLLGLDPAVGVKDEGVGKDGWVHVHEVVALADGCLSQQTIRTVKWIGDETYLCWDRPSLVLNDLVGHSRQSAGDAMHMAQSFVDHTVLSLSQLATVNNFQLKIHSPNREAAPAAPTHTSPRRP